MASLQKIARQDRKGKVRDAWRIVLSDREKRTVISLGIMPKKAAELCLSMVEQIAAANAAGQSLPVEVASWTAKIEDGLHKKLVDAKLLQQRQRRTLGTFVADYINERTDWKPMTRTSFTTMTKKMLDFFGEDTLIDKITVDDVVAFRLNLQTTKKDGKKDENKYTEATISKTIKRCRQVFALARRRKLIADNPFETIKAGSQRNPSRFHFVTEEETQALIDACNSPKQRLIIALARYGGLRSPSELVGLKWSEVNWGRDRFIVHSPKTEGKGKAQRAVPIFKELYPFFREAFEAAPEGVDRVYPEFTDKKSLGAFIKKTAIRAGIPLWEKPFQNMRSTRATELVEVYPAHIVNAWLGHTEAVAMAHYRQSTGKAADKFFEQAAGSNKTPGTEKGAKTVAEHAGIECSGVEADSLDTIIRASFYPAVSRICNAFLNNAEGAKSAPMTPTGIEPVPRP